MGEWHATSYAGKDTILTVLRDEADRLFALAEPSRRVGGSHCMRRLDDPRHRRPSVNTTEGYFAAFDAARGQSDSGDPYGLPRMMANVGKERERLPIHERNDDRLRTDFAKMFRILGRIGPEEWAGFIVTHFYMGPVPAFFYAAGQLMDYGVHSWDIRQGSGRAHGLSGDAADLLVPFMFVLWQSTVNADADLSPMQIGIRVSGHNGGDYRVSVDQEG